MVNVVRYELFRLERSRNLHRFLEKIFHTADNRTSFVYDASTGRKTQEINALDKSKTFTYNARGQIISIRGDIDYPVDYIYDSYGRMSQLKTYRDANLANPDITTWTYQDSTGLLTAKTYADNKSVTYTYTAAGQLATRTWSRQTPDPNPQPLLTSYSYNLAGDLTGIDYSDSTPDITFTYNRLGQQLTVTDAVGSRTFGYNDDLQPSTETITGLYSRTLTKGYDTFGRDNSLSLNSGYTVSYSFDVYGRHNGLTMNSQTINYGFTTDSDLIGSITRTNGVDTAISYESNRDLITQVQHVGTGNLATYGFTNDALNRRTSMAESGSAFSQSDTIDYGYNDRSEVISAESQNIPAYDYAYAFDPIGNRLSSRIDDATRSYTTNNINQYSAVTNPSDNPTYDFDGNMLTMKLSSGEWTAAWDCENRLIAMEKSDEKLEFKYDYMSRRVEKKVFTGSSGNWTLASCERFIYNNYRQIERVSVEGENQSVVQRFAWSLDDQLRLITDVSSGTTYSVHHDANRNVTELTAPDGSLVAHYEYAPFGGLTVSTGAYADSNPFHFSSEYFDAETGLVYYNYRYYSPQLGRFLSRDPIEETGFRVLYNIFSQNPYSRTRFDYNNSRYIERVLEQKIFYVIEKYAKKNPYSFASNNSLNHIDPTGLCDTDPKEDPCKEAENILKPNTAGHLVCHNGKLLACAWNKDNDKYKKYPGMLKCVQAHEDEHVKQSPNIKCEPCKTYLPEEKDENKRKKAECGAFFVELDCLLNEHKNDCGTDYVPNNPFDEMNSCEASYWNQISNVQMQMRENCQ